MDDCQTIYLTKILKIEKETLFGIVHANWIETILFKGHIPIDVGII
jgi:hypothetical protein